MRVGMRTNEANFLSDSGETIGPKLRALLLAQPLNPLRKLEFRELPSRRAAEQPTASSGSQNEQHEERPLAAEVV